MTKKFNLGLKVYFLIYFIAILLVNLSDLYGHFFGNWFKVFNASGKLSLTAYLVFIIGIMIILMSVIAAVLVFKKTLSKKLYIMPLWIFLQDLWLVIIPVVITLQNNIVKSVELLDTLSKYDFITYILSIIISVYMISFIIKENGQN
mgnify:CR=1 FL=1